MFGEEDVIEKQNRQYTAISTHSQTVLYVLPSEVIISFRRSLLRFFLGL